MPKRKSASTVSLASTDSSELAHGVMTGADYNVEMLLG